MMHENPINMPDWFVPEIFYYLWDDDVLVEEYRIRHYLIDVLKIGAEDIGYSIKSQISSGAFSYESKKYSLDSLILGLDTFFRGKFKKIEKR